jgi:hypothetical protein
VITRKANLVWLCLLVLVLILSGWALSTRFNSTATIRYQFEAPNQSEHNLTLVIPLNDYRGYKERSRPSYEAELTRHEVANKFLEAYSAMATDPSDDAIINSIVRQLNDEVVAEDLSELKKIQLVLGFVQSLTYAKDVVPTAYDEYPQYPIETLFEQGGDCEDTSILIVAILTEMDFDVALLLFEEFDHMGVGINFDVRYGNSWIYGDGRRYWYLDTTGGHSLGWCPEPYDVTSAYVYPVR